MCLAGDILDAGGDVETPASTLFGKRVRGLSVAVGDEPSIRFLFQTEGVPVTQPSEEEACEVGRRQSLSREVNERIEELFEDFDLMDEMEIMCECGYNSCSERIKLSDEQYERLRRIPTHFAVLAGHEIPAVERVVERHDGFIVVEKVGDAAITAVRLDPRRAKHPRRGD